MTRYEILRQLDRVADRHRQLRILVAMAIVWFIAAILTVALWVSEPYTGWSLSSPTVLGFIALVGCGLLLVAVLRSRMIDPYQLARCVERRFPELNQRLLAAMEQSPSDDTGRYSILQQQLFREAAVHGRRHDWVEAIPSRHIFATFCLQFFCFLFFGTVLLFAIGREDHAIASIDAQPVHGEAVDLYTESLGLTVDPGNIEIERGTSLLVLARFLRSAPSEVTLVFTDETGETRRFPLTKSLDDPLFGGRIEAVGSDLIYHVEFGGRESDRYQVKVFDFPQLEQSDFTVEYPDYTLRETVTLEDAARVTVVEGSKVKLTCRLNKPVRSAQLVGAGRSPISLQVIDESRHIYEVVLQPEAKSEYRLQLVDEADRRNKFPPTFVIDVLPNRRPEIKLTFPARDVRVSPLEELALEATAWDDFGLTQYGVIYTVSGGEPNTIVLGENSAGNEESTLNHLIALEEQEVKPDDLLSWYVFADDIGPDGNVRRTYSDMYFAEVRPFDEIFRQGMQPPGGGQQQAGGKQQNQDVDGLVQLQKQIVTATWNLLRLEHADRDSFAADVHVIAESQSAAREKATELQKKLKTVQSQAIAQTAIEQMTRAAELLNSIAESQSDSDLPDALTAEQAAYQSLLKLRAREHQVSQSSSSGQSGGGSSGNRSQAQLNQLELNNKQNRYQTQKSASSPQDSVDREQLQVLNRLRELAKRQNTINDKLRELEAALREAQTDAEREEIRRQLKRLREQQQELLRDVDQLRNRMDRQQNQPDLAQSRRQLDQTRERIRESTEALRDGQVSKALSEGTRAQRELSNLRDEFRKNSAGQFDEAMRNLRNNARDLANEQHDLADKLDDLESNRRRTLRTSRDRKEIEQGLQDQKEKLSELFDEMRELVQQAEQSEPLLSKQLYDTVRKTEQQKTLESLDAASQLAGQGLLPDAQQAEDQAHQGIRTFQQGVEKAAESVLGEDVESLKRAKNQLNDLAQSLRNEVSQAKSPTPEPSANSQKPNGDAPKTPNGDPSESNNQSASNNPSQSDNSSPSNSQQQSESSSTQQASSAATPSGSDSQSPQNQPGSKPGQPSSKPPSFLQQGGLTGGAGGGPGGPLTGNDFQEWSDQLRDVEEMVDDPHLREQVTKIRQRARSVRVDFKRHSKEPNWDLVQVTVLKPLMEIQDLLAEEIAKRESPDSLVPLDRDPVPKQFDEVVRKYYQRLGEGENAGEKRFADRPGDRTIR